MCFACRTKKPKSRLWRLMTEDGVLRLDRSGKAGGRGIYVCRCADCLEKLARRKKWRGGADPAQAAAFLRQLAAQEESDE